jgi:hypothetical protein
MPFTPEGFTVDDTAAANLLLATWTVAFIRAHRAYRESQDAEKAKSVFLALIEVNPPTLYPICRWIPSE